MLAKLKNLLTVFWHLVFGDIRTQNTQMTDSDCHLYIQASYGMSESNQELNTSGIVFSFDRAMQLHALLGSYRDQVTNGPKLSVIYKASSESHNKAYQEVFEEFSDCILFAIKQETKESFKEILIDILTQNNSKNVFFLVDDNLFIEPLDLSSFALHANSFTVPTFRLGENLNFSYVVQKVQPKPKFLAYQCNSNELTPSIDLLSWVWINGDLDWGYPLSVDGHLFQRKELLAICKAIWFDSPNSFETHLQSFLHSYQYRLGICFRKSRLINIPYNRVQSDFNNLSGQIHQDEMLYLWSQGNRINRVAYYNLINVSAHQEMPLKLTQVMVK